MNARERAKELAELFELHDNAYVAGVIRDLLAEIERLEVELKAQKRDAWNHEGVSKDYILAMKKIKNQEEQIIKLEQENKHLKARLVKLAINAASVAEANIQAEIASGGTSCHWCMDKTRQQAARDAITKLAKIKVVPQPHNMETAEAYNRGVSAAIGTIKRYFGFKEE